MRVRRSAIALVCVLTACASPAWGYRPYDSTDADVADEDELQLELGWSDSTAASEEDLATGAVLSYGLGHGREIMIEGQWRQSEIDDVALRLKQVHRRGSLQDAPGFSIASECGVLIPTTNEETGVGGECKLVASHRYAALMLHADAGIEFDTAHRWGHSFAVILEGADSWRWRPGLELLYEDAAGETAGTSILAGMVWNTTEDLALDVAWRQALQPSGEPGEWRVGFTWSH